MKKLIIMALSVTTVLALAAVAFAQSAAPTISATLDVSEAGTKAKPGTQGRVDAIFNINPESNSTLRRIEYQLPAGVKLDGKGFPTCSEEQVDTEGESSCPPGSQVGTGGATALLGPNKTPLVFTVNVYAAGPKELTLSLNGVTADAFPATINGSTVAFDIPAGVQQPVPGLYSYVTSVTANLGNQDGVPATTKVKQKKTIKKNGKKKKKTITVTKPFVSVTSCPSGGQAGSITAFLANNPNPPSVPSVSANATDPC